VTGRPADLSRALKLLAAIDERTVEVVRRWSAGTALLTPSLPGVWDANYLRVERSGELDVDSIAAEATDVAAEAGIDAVAIVVEDEGLARDAAPRLRELSFDATRFLLMGLREAPPRPDAAVAEAGFDDVRSSRREIMLEAFPGSDELADQLMELDRRLESSAGGRWFVVREAGAVVARAWLRGEGGVGQVEDVATAIPARGRGLARAVVSAAARASVDAGDELTFVVADADETTPRLYETVGFEPIGVTYRFVRPLSSAGSDAREDR
jgi:ribosomal protein S18 acetylase RimI-like enzyme